MHPSRTHCCFLPSTTCTNVCPLGTNFRELLVMLDELNKRWGRVSIDCWLLNSAQLLLPSSSLLDSMLRIQWGFEPTGREGEGVFLCFLLPPQNGCLSGPQAFKSVCSTALTWWICFLFCFFVSCIHLGEKPITNTVEKPFSLKHEHPKQSDLFDQWRRSTQSSRFYCYNATLMWKATANKTRSLFIFPHGFMKPGAPDGRFSPGHRLSLHEMSSQFWVKLFFFPLSKVQDKSECRVSIK